MLSLRDSMPAFGRSTTRSENQPSSNIPLYSNEDSNALKSQPPRNVANAAWLLLFSIGGTKSEISRRNPAKRRISGTYGTLKERYDQGAAFSIIFASVP